MAARTGLPPHVIESTWERDEVTAAIAENQLANGEFRCGKDSESLKTIDETQSKINQYHEDQLAWLKMTIGQQRKMTELQEEARDFRSR